jgi:hypothetical protein
MVSKKIEGVITKEILKSILQVDLKEFWWKEFYRT